MATIELTTRIQAPVARCFDLSRSIDLHVTSTSTTGERAVAGVTTGLIGLNEEVTWRAKHLGVWQEFTSRITALDRPHYFQDTMVRGAFRSFQHDHYFVETGNATTEMKDVLRFQAPIPILGLLAEIFLRPYLRKFLRERNALVKTVAESDEWTRYLPVG